MSDFDLFDDDAPLPDLASTLEEPLPGAPRRRGGCSNLFYNLLTVSFLLASALVCAAVILLIRNPESPYNPFAPQQTGQPALDALSAADDVTPASPPTADPTDQPTPTNPPPSATPMLFLTSPPVAQPTQQPAPQATATGATPPIGAVNNTPSQYPFMLDGEVEYDEYTGAEQCDYLAVKGTVTNMDGEPVVGIPVVVEGDEFFESLVLSGSAPRYGQSGYEVVLNDAPVEATFTVQLWSDTGFQISPPVTVETTEDCEENLITVNFVATQPLD